MVRSTLSDAGGKEAGRVLVCDDERHIVRLIQANLERQGYVVEVAYSGAVALARIAEGGFDIAVIDPTLPDMLGSEVVRQILENPATADIRIILLDGTGDLNDPLGPDLNVRKGCWPFGS